MASVRGQVAIITGAASGIGRATSLLFARRGARVVAADINDMGGQETVDLIRGAGGDGVFVKTNVTSAGEVQALVERSLAVYGSVHVLHNNAGLMRVRDSIDQIPEDEWRLVIDVDLNSLFLLARAVWPVMRKQGGGAIINTASLAALTAFPTGLSYAAAKAGVLGFTRSLAALGQKDRIRVNCVCPASVDTPLLNDNTPEAKGWIRQRGVLQPHDVARAVHHLATTETATGMAVSILLEDGQPRYYKVSEAVARGDAIEGVAG